MSVITKGVDNSARMFGRGVTFVSGVDFNVNDILDIEMSVGGTAAEVVVSAGSGAACTFRVNSLNRRYPPLSTAKSLGIPAPDLQSEATWISTAAISYSLAADESMTLTIPVANLQFTAVTDTVTVKATV